MENNKSLFWNQAMKWGLIISSVLIVVSLAFYLTGNPTSTAEGWLQYPIIIGGIILATISFKKLLPEKAPFSYGTALGYGVATMLFASIVLAVYTFVLYQFIAPDLIGIKLEAMEEALLDSGLNDNMVEQQIKMYHLIFKPSFLAFGQIIGGVFGGFFVSLVTSIFLRKKSSSSYNQMMSEIDDEA
jgi:hypothetical protein